MGKNAKQPFNIRLSPDEFDLLDRVADRFGGNKTLAFVEGLRALDSGKSLSRDALLAEIKRRLK